MTRKAERAGYGRGMPTSKTGRPAKNTLDDRVTVAIGCFDAITYSGLAAILATDSRIAVIASGLSAAELEALVSRHTPQVAILNEGSRGTELERLNALAPQIRLLIVAHKPSRAYRAETLAMGAACVARAVSADDLIAAVHLVARAEQVFTTGDGRHLAYQHIEARSLTQREREVLVHLTNGKSHAKIALALKISPRTVEKHTARIAQKMAAHRGL